MTWSSAYLNRAGSALGRVAVDQYALRSDHPTDCSYELGDSPDKVASRGGGCCCSISPPGDTLAAPNDEGEAVLTADIDLAEITRGKFDFDATGHYARPDVFKLVVNERPTPPVVFEKE